MTSNAKFEGLDEVNAYIDMLVSKISGPLSERFVTEILIAVEANTAPFVPVRTSNLINSAYRKVQHTRNGYTGEFGYGADYAGPVHDGPDKNWKKAGASNRFLIKGVEETLRNDFDVIAKRVFKK